MPNRILRGDILTSEPVNGLGWAEECFYRRLHSIVDDFGRYYGHPSLIRAAAYPLRLNDVSDQDVGKWLAVCATKGLVRVYLVEGKRYIEVVKFGQQVRAVKSRFPELPCNCEAPATHLNSDCVAPAHLDGDGDVDVDEGDVLSGKPDAAQLLRQAKQKRKTDAIEVLTFLNQKAGRNYRPTDTNLGFIVGRLAEGATVTECRQVIAKKCRKWLGTDQADYLRPETLFNKTKFNSYQGELVAPDKPDAANP